jgi:hypothetical protein
MAVKGSPIRADGWFDEADWILKVEIVGRDPFLNPFWPASSDASFHLQQNPALNPAGWMNATNAVGTNGNESQVIITMPAGNVFYRLINP